MNNITFTVQGDPQGKERPRMTRSGHTYTPKKTKDYEKSVQKAFLEQAGKENFEIIKKPHGVAVNITARFQIPKSYTKKKRAAIESGKLSVTKKPDIDNIAKIITDACNGLCYEDDSQVNTLFAKKEWTDDNSSVEVTITESEDRSCENCKWNGTNCADAPIGKKCNDCEQWSEVGL